MTLYFVEEFNNFSIMNQQFVIKQKSFLSDIKMEMNKSESTWYRPEKKYFEKYF